jgi:hypothetical protein
VVFFEWDDEKAEEEDDDLRPEYPPDFFKNMKPNRFAGKELHYKRDVAVDADKHPKTPAKRRRS